MTVFLAHAPKDRETAEGLEKFLERRGQFVELDDGQTALRPVQASDVVVLLLSKDFVFAPTRLRLEQRALDAWADGRLLVVKLDHGIAPVGLRDLPALDASFAAQREFKWQELANSIREKLRAQVQAPAGEDGVAAPTHTRRKSRGGWLGVLGLITLMAPGLAALVATGSIWLVNRIGPTPGGWPELSAGIDAFGVRYGAPAGVTLWGFTAAIAMLIVCLGLLVGRAFSRPRVQTRKQTQPAPTPRQAEPSAPEQTDALFVSYARANAGVVTPIIEAVSREGRKFWLDQKGIAAGESWAGEIVRAMRGAAGVVIMCSKAAFESDHVKREVYLADRYRKRILPVFIEDTPPPEDFEYFFAGVQRLNLFATPEAERSQALMQALGAPS